MASNTAIFYDIENLMGIFNLKTSTELHLEEIYRKVLEVDSVTGVSMQRAYADWGVPMYRNLRSSVLQVGIEPIQIFNTNQNDRVKNAADISLIIDAVDLAARNPDITNFVIASGDGIFAFLSKKLHEHGKRVIGCGFEKIVNNIFRLSCDSFIGLEKADKAIIATPISTDLVATKPPKAPKAPQVKKSGKKNVPLPKSKYTDILLKAKIDTNVDARDKSAVMHLVRQMVEVLFTEETKDFPGLEISIFANYINHHLADFKVKSFGFKGFADFMRLLFTGSNYCVYSIETNVVLIGPRAAADAVGGKKVEDVQGLLIATNSGERFNSFFNVPAGAEFVYNVQKEAKFKLTKPNPSPKALESTQESTAIEATIEAKPEPESEPTKKESSIRKFVKEQFIQLATNNSLTKEDIANLSNQKYCVATFGVRAQILRKIEEGRPLSQQRVQNNRVKYWKEPFQFDGENYLVYKEWANIHKERFTTWCTACNGEK